MRKYWVALMIVGLTLISCSKSTDNHGIGVQPVLFEYEYVNHAWIYTHFGWMIDAEGQILGYTRTDDWIHPADNHISKEDLIHNLNLCDTVFGTADELKLLKYYDLRYDFASSEVDTADQYMADAGTGTLFVYIWDSKKQSYNRAVLASRGDIQMTNQHFNAAGAIRFLVDEGAKTDRFFWDF